MLWYRIGKPVLARTLPQDEARLLPDAYVPVVYVSPGAITVLVTGHTVSYVTSTLSTVSICCFREAVQTY